MVRQFWKFHFHFYEFQKLPFTVSEAKQLNEVRFIHENNKFYVELHSHTSVSVRITTHNRRFQITSQSFLPECYHRRYNCYIVCDVTHVFQEMG